jgi:hypothetical protein
MWVAAPEEEKYKRPKRFEVTMAPTPKIWWGNYNLDLATLMTLQST